MMYYSFSRWADGSNKRTCNIIEEACAIRVASQVTLYIVKLARVKQDQTKHSRNASSIFIVFTPLL
eukprot:6145665-Amphidinium_carterae.1